jgi:hypothetical protein
MPVMTVSLRTNDGHFVTIVNGGGFGGPNSGPGVVALHTDAKIAGPWEQFRLEWLEGNNLALKTASGNYVTAVNGGGISGSNDASCPVHTDATDPTGTWQQVTLNYDQDTQIGTIQTVNGYYLTAVNGGGIGGANNVPIHTDATTIGPWETFSAGQWGEL